jgi:tetratricopeptide (TPR) repeat protein
VEFYDKEIEVWEHVVSDAVLGERALDLAKAYLNKADLIGPTGNYLGVAMACDRAILILERLASEKADPEVSHQLAEAYRYRGLVADHFKQPRVAVALFAKAITILERLFNQEGRQELAFDLGRAKANRGESLIALGEKVEGLEDLRSARAIAQAAFLRTGHDEVKRFLGWLEQLIAKHLPPE